MRHLFGIFIIASYVCVMVLETEQIFNNPVCRHEFGALSKDMFVSRRRIAIDSLHPRQRWIEKEILADKIKGKRHTKIYVGCGKERNILFDGHHTAAAKKIKGQKYVIAYCVDL